ncbi:MAG: hypothetical protein JNK15_06430, partial [Planctomycetes bacterium]|nr:hypothetical protein [Planctomycetota bacterium]
IALSGRLDPLDVGHPPAGSPVLQLLPGNYVAQGGPIDPQGYRYYTQANGTLTGVALNAGGIVQLAAAGAVQLGCGAGQGNRFFGTSGSFTATIVQQPTARTLAPTGPLAWNGNLAIGCILPAPVVLTGIAQTTPSVTEQRLVFTGVDLGFCEQAAIGPWILGADSRRFFEGHLRVVDHTTVEVAIPQGLAPAIYPMRLLNRTLMSNPLTVDVQAPTVPTMRTASDRLVGEPQHWVTHQGNVAGFVFCFLAVSLSSQPSTFPGIVDLQIGNQFTDLLVLDAALHDPVTGCAVVAIPAVPATLQGVRLHSQSALMDAAIFPLTPSNSWFTDY